jgi:hypothetical protein
VAKVAADNAYANRKAINWQRLVDAGMVVNPRGGDIMTGDVRIKGSDNKSNFDAGYGSVQMSSADSVQIELRSLPVDTAMRVLAALKGGK